MELPDHNNVRFKSCAPELFDKLGVSSGGDGQVCVPVAAVVPPHLLGAGAGLTSEGGSIHVQTTDKAELGKHGLDQLRLAILLRSRTMTAVGITAIGAARLHWRDWAG